MRARSSATRGPYLKEGFEPDREPLRQVSNPAGREQDTRHERVPVERIVADRERLALAAEDHLLMGKHPRKPDGMDAVDVPSRLGNALRRVLGRSRRRVALLGPVKLDDL